MKQSDCQAAVVVVLILLVADIGLAGVAAATGTIVARSTEGAQGEPGDECVQGPDPVAGAVEYETIDLASVLASISVGLPVTLPFYQRQYQLQLTQWGDAVASNATLAYVDEAGAHSVALTSVAYR